MRVDENLTAIYQQIEEACNKVDRIPNEVTIIAVTKYVTIERTIEAYNAGVKNLGENRDEGLISKWNALKDKPTWHYIGSLQTRKVKNIIDKVDYIHSLDRLSLAKEIHKRAHKKVNCLIQVNVSGEESKHGISPEEITNFVLALEEFTNIEIVGLMTMAPFTSNESLLRECFKKLKNIQTHIQEMNLKYAPCTELSMGMSNDFIIAIEEGATMIRIGTALVGNEQKEVR